MAETKCDLEQYLEQTKPETTLFGDDDLFSSNRTGKNSCSPCFYQYLRNIENWCEHQQEEIDDSVPINSFFAPLNASNPPQFLHDLLSSCYPKSLPVKCRPAEKGLEWLYMYAVSRLAGRFWSQIAPVLLISLTVVTLNGLILWVEKQKNVGPPKFQIWPTLKVLIVFDGVGAASGAAHIIVQDILMVHRSGVFCYISTVYLLMIFSPVTMTLIIITASLMIQIGICSDRITGLSRPLAYKTRNPCRRAIYLTLGSLLAATVIVGGTLVRYGTDPRPVVVRQLLLRHRSTSSDWQHRITSPSSIEDDFCSNQLVHAFHQQNVNPQRRPKSSIHHVLNDTGGYNYDEEHFKCDPRLAYRIGGGSCQLRHHNRPKLTVYAVIVAGLNTVLLVRSLQLIRVFRAEVRRRHQLHHQQSSSTASTSGGAAVGGGKVKVVITSLSSSATAPLPKTLKRSAISSSSTFPKAISHHPTTIAAERKPPQPKTTSARTVQNTTTTTSKTLTVVALFECFIGVTQSTAFILNQLLWTFSDGDETLIRIARITDTVTIGFSGFQLCSNFISLAVLSKSFRFGLRHLFGISGD